MRQGNVSARATSLTQSGTRRLLRCHACATPVSATHAPVFFDLRTAEDHVRIARNMLLGRVDLTGSGCVLGGTEQTALAWRKRAADTANESHRPLLRNLPVTPGQCDEMGNVLAHQHAHPCAPDGERLSQSAEGRHGRGSSSAPAFQRMRAAFIGPRTSDRAMPLIHMTAAGVSGIPCFFSEGFRCYSAARVAVSQQITEWARTGKRGRPRPPVVEPYPDLVDAQIVMPKTHGRQQF